MKKLLPLIGRRWMTCSALVISAGLVLAFPSLVIDVRAESARVKDWVSVHRGNLPASFQEFREYPFAYQKAIFEQLTPQTKSKIMRERLASALETEQLTADQRALLTKAMDLFSPESYMPNRKDEV